MHRREFIKNTIITSAGLMVIPYLGNTAQYSPITSNLEQLFLNPPDDVRPWAYWMWMNGNITMEGITLDLEAMKRMGIGGVMNFNAAVGIPRGPVDYAGDQWAEMVVHAAKEAERLGLVYYMHNSPGYSGCGGAWITPEMSMQQLVWTEQFITSNGSSLVGPTLERPYAKRGFYRDAMVIAYPSLPVQQSRMKDKLVRVVLNGREIDMHTVTDGNPETKIRMEVNSKAALNLLSANTYDFVSSGGGKRDDNSKASKNSPASTLVLEFSEPFESRAISIYRKPEVPLDLFDGARDIPPNLLLESSPDGNNYTPVGRIPCVELRQMDTPSTLSYNVVKAKFYRLTTTSATWISEVALHTEPRLGGWAGKTNQTHGSSAGATPEFGAELLIDPQQVVDITAYLSTQGDLNWKAPKGNWTILRIGHTTTGEIPAAHPDAGDGLEIDMFNRAALDLHFEKFLDPLLTKVGACKGKSFMGFLVDSWEAGKSNWTAKFPAEFKTKRGYSLLSWMPAMTGRIVSSINETERFLWDIRRTHADLLARNFYGYFQECCHQRGLAFSAEPYGDGVFDSLQSGKYLDFPMSEFWTRHIYGGDSTSMQAASLAHVYGKKVAAAESFTAMPLTSKWTDYPYSLKAEGDYFFTLGINRMVFHAVVHQPYRYGKPGMTYGPFGTHFDRNNSWAEEAYGWTSYIKRSQYLLQQGLTVTDICYFKGDSPESGVPNIYDFLPRGYAADVIGPDAFDRFTISNNVISLPDGMSYKVMVLAKLPAVTISTLERIKQFVAAGMILVVSGKPDRSYTLSDRQDKVNRSIADLYGDLDGLNSTERQFGKGRIIWDDDLSGVMSRLKIEPDFTYSSENPDATIHYIHKKGDGVEFYFISNHRRRKERVQCSLRLNGLQPEWWDGQTGQHFEQPVFTIEGDRTLMAFDLEPSGSVFIMFRKKVEVQTVFKVFQDGEQLLALQPFALPSPAPFPDVKNNFTVSLWAKPDTYAHNGKSMLFHTINGGKAYGGGHATAGLGAGQNGVTVYENANGKAVKVLSSIGQIQGWTHIAIVYVNGKPSLFLNGEKNNTGQVSQNIVHPALKTPADPGQFASYFEGNYTAPVLYERVLTDMTIKDIYEAGLPPLNLIPGFSIRRPEAGVPEAEIFANGKYKVSTQDKLLDVSSCKSLPFKEEWTVSFSETNLPDLVLKSLSSLHKHPEFDVRHFSGTAIYRYKLHIRETEIKPEGLFFLDLGRVEVLAKVTLNGVGLGMAWKEPYILPVTSAIKSGENIFEISVTNLWPNRLIGDEYLPEENVYSKDHYIEKLPDWYINNQPKPGRRTTFSVWKNLDKDDPLLESGLLGPVNLHIGEKHRF